MWEGEEHSGRGGVVGWSEGGIRVCGRSVGSRSRSSVSLGEDCGAVVRYVAVGDEGWRREGVWA